MWGAGGDGCPTKRILMYQRQGAAQGGLGGNESVFPGEGAAGGLQVVEDGGAGRGNLHPVGRFQAREDLCR